MALATQTAAPILDIAGGAAPAPSAPDAFVP